MSELTVAGQKIGRIPDASSPELLPAEVPLEMPDQDFKARAASKPRRRRGYWVPRAAVFTGAGIADGGVRARALRRAGCRAGNAAAGSLPHSVDHRLRLDRARLAQCGAGLHSVVRRREGRHDRPAAPRRAADERVRHSCSPSTTRIPRASPARCRRSRSNWNRWAALRRSTSSCCPTRAMSAKAPPRRAPIAPCAIA